MPAFGGPAMATTRPSRSRSPRPALGQRRCDLVAQLLRSMKRRTDQILRHIGLVGKIDPRLDQRQRFDQSPPPGLGPIADQTLELPKRLPPLRRRLGGDQIGKTLDRGEIEPAVLERAAGELARLGQPAPFDLPQRIEHPGDHRVAAVKLQLRHIFAGLAVRRRKPQRQRLIDRLAASPDRARAPAPPSAAPARGRSAFPARRARRTGNAHHGNRRRRPAGGESENGGAIRHDCLCVP